MQTSVISHSAFLAARHTVPGAVSRPLLSQHRSAMAHEQPLASWQPVQHLSGTPNPGSHDSPGSTIPLPQKKAGESSSPGGRTAASASASASSPLSRQPERNGFASAASIAATDSGAHPPSSSLVRGTTDMILFAASTWRSPKLWPSSCAAVSAFAIGEMCRTCTAVTANSRRPGQFWLTRSA